MYIQFMQGFLQYYTDFMFPILFFYLLNLNKKYEQLRDN